MVVGYISDADSKRVIIGARVVIHRPVVVIGDIRDANGSWVDVVARVRCLVCNI